MFSSNTYFENYLRQNKNNRLNEVHPVGKYAVEIEKRLQKLEKIKTPLELSNTICLSRHSGSELWVLPNN